jgi:hypothetical protein
MHPPQTSSQCRDKCIFIIAQKTGKSISSKTDKRPQQDRAQEQHHPPRIRAYPPHSQAPSPSIMTKRPRSGAFPFNTLPQNTVPFVRVLVRVFGGMSEGQGGPFLWTFTVTASSDLLGRIAWHSLLNVFQPRTDCRHAVGAISWAQVARAWSAMRISHLASLHLCYIEGTRTPCPLGHSALEFSLLGAN